MDNDLTYGIELDGAFFNEDGSTLTWIDFVDKIESVGLQYGGKTCPVDSEGDYYTIVDGDIVKWELERLYLDDYVSNSTVIVSNLSDTWIGVYKNDTLQTQGDFVSSHDVIDILISFNYSEKVYYLKVKDSYIQDEQYFTQRFTNLPDNIFMLKENKLVFEYIQRLINKKGESDIG